MPNMMIATNEDQIRFGTSKYVTQYPATRWCIEMVSEEMFEALLQIAHDPNHKKTVSYILYNILEQK